MPAPSHPLEALQPLKAGRSADYLTCGGEWRFAEKVPLWSPWEGIVSGDDTHTHTHAERHKEAYTVY